MEAVGQYSTVQYSTRTTGLRWSFRTGPSYSFVVGVHSTASGLGLGTVYFLAALVLDPRLASRSDEDEEAEKEVVMAALMPMALRGVCVLYSYVL